MLITDADTHTHTQYTHRPIAKHTSFGFRKPQNALELQKLNFGNFTQNKTFFFILRELKKIEISDMLLIFQDTILSPDFTKCSLLLLNYFQE